MGSARSTVACLRCSQEGSRSAPGSAAVIGQALETTHGRPRFRVPAEIRNRKVAGSAHNDPALWCESCWERLDSFERFDLMHRDELAAYVRRHCYGGSDDVADVVQDTLLAAHRCWERVERPERWMFQVSKRKIFIHGKKRQRSVPLAGARGDDRNDSTPDIPEQGALDLTLEEVDDAAADQHALEIAHRLMDEKLTPRQRDAFVENVVKDRPGAEVAEEQETSRSAIYNRSHGAKKILQKEFKELAAATGAFFSAIALAIGATVIALIVKKIVSESHVPVEVVANLLPVLAAALRARRKQTSNDNEQQRGRRPSEKSIDQ